MIRGIGVDMVNVSRMEKAINIPNFIRTNFTCREVENQHGDRATYYATRFACKEAIYKAIGCQIDFRLIETLNDTLGKPYVSKIEGYENADIHISITTEDKNVIAFCIVEI